MEVINFRIEIVLISYLGNTPEYMFMAIVPSNAFSGTTSTSSTDFRNDKVAELNLKLNGNSVHGYPIRITKNYPIWPYLKYLEVTNRAMNVKCSQQTTIDNYATNQIYAHKFEAEETQQGWLSLSLALDSVTGYDKPHSLGIMLHDTVI